MIQLFTLNIRYKSKEYVALVSLRQQANEVNCLVRYVDRGLQYLLPGDNLVFGLDGTLKVPEHLPNELYENLTQCTATAVSTYLLLSKN